MQAKITGAQKYSPNPWREVAVTGEKHCEYEAKSKERDKYMTEKARKILEGLRKRYQLRMSDAKAREKVLSEFNQATLDDVHPLGGDQGIAVLNDMNELQSDHDEFVKGLAPSVNVL